jgi:hypothetical protein
MLNVILDLDSTCIFAVDVQNLSKLDPRINQHLRYFDHYENDKFIYRIYERPMLQDFLDYLFANFNVAVWTAAEYNYGQDIVKHFIEGKNTGRKIKFFYSKRIFEQAALQYTNRSKPLEYIYSQHPGWNRCNTFIVDDNPHVKKSNPKNCLQIKPFNVLTDSYRPVSVNTVLQDNNLFGIYGMLEFHRGINMTDLMCWNF